MSQVHWVNVPAPAVASSVDLVAPSRAERGLFKKIEQYRKRLGRSTSTVELIDGRTRKLGRVAQVSPVWGRRLFRLIRMAQPQRCLELGTSSGFSAAYQAAALDLNGSGRLITLEGAPAVAQLAVQNLAALALSADVIPGLFKDTLDGALELLEEVDYAFIDGHHDEHATLRYLDQIAPYLTSGAVVVFDDIRWSRGMRRAWAKIRKHAAFWSTASWGRMGLCLVNSKKG